MLFIIYHLVCESVVLLMHSPHSPLHIASVDMQLAGKETAPWVSYM